MNKSLIDFVRRCSSLEIESEKLLNYTERIVNMCINSLYDSAEPPKNAREAEIIINKKFKEMRNFSYTLKGE